MELSAILLARFVTLVEAVDLDPHGHVHYPRLVQALVQRLEFQKFPRTPEELDEAKGIVFMDGLYEGVPVNKLTIFANGLVVETRSSTRDSERILHENLAWAAKEFGLRYSPELINKRKMYVSQLSFHSDEPILSGLSPVLQKLSKLLSESVTSAAGERLAFATTSIAIGHDVLATKYPIAGLSVQRRVEAPFSENKYFSEAPLQTEDHIKLLQDLESDLRAKK